METHRIQVHLENILIEGNFLYKLKMDGCESWFSKPRDVNVIYSNNKKSNSS